MANTAREIAPRGAENKADIDKMLNDKQFLEALSANDPDAEVTEDNNELQEKYEVFGKAQEVAKEIAGVYRDKIFQDIGVKMDKTEFQAIEIYINKQVFDNPKEIKKIALQIKEYKEAPNRISQKERELEELTGGKDFEETKKDLREQRMRLMNKSNMIEISKRSKREVLDKDKENRNFVTKRWASFWKSDKGREKEINSLEADVTSINFSSEELGEKIKNLEDADRLRKEIKKEADGAREKLFSNFEPMEEIATRAREKANEKFSMLVKDGELKKLEEAQKFYEHLQGLSEGEGWNNYAESLELKSGMGLSEVQEYLDYVIEGAITEEFEKAVDNFKIGERPLEKMENALKPLLRKVEIGSKDNKEVEDFIVETLGGIAKNTSKAKRILINRIIGKMGKGLYNETV